MYDREEFIQEKAPPGAKYERMVKHIKKRYAKDGLTDKEKSIAYATAWKQYGKTHKEEVTQIDEGLPALAAGAAAIGAGVYGLHKLGQSMKQDRQTGAKARPNTIQSNIQKRRAAEAELLGQSYELNGELVDEARRSEKEGKGSPEQPLSFPGRKIQKERGEKGGRHHYSGSVEYGGAQTERGRKKSDPQSQAQRLRSLSTYPEQPGKYSKMLRKKHNVGSRFDHYELDGDSLQEKYLYTYLYERNYDALDKDVDGDKDFADVMIARMIASGKSREEAIKATMNKEYNKKGKKVKISDEFSDWRSEFSESLVKKKSPFVEIMPKDHTSTDESESLKAARKRQHPNQKVTEETLEEFADSLGGFLVEAEQLDELAPAVAVASRALPFLVRAVTTAAKSPAARSAIVKGPRAFRPSVPKPVPTPKPAPVKPKPAPAPAKPKPAPAPTTIPKPTPGPITKPKPAPKKSQISVLLEPLVKPSPTTKPQLKRTRKTPIPTVTGTGTKVPGGGTPGGSGPGGKPRRGGGINLPIPGIPKLDWQGHIGYTKNPQ